MKQESRILVRTVSEGHPALTRNHLVQRVKKLTNLAEQLPPGHLNASIERSIGAVAHFDAQQRHEGTYEKGT